MSLWWLAVPSSLVALWVVAAAAVERRGAPIPRGPPGDWVVVLGAKVGPDGSASPALERRVRAGIVALDHAGPGAKIVFTGGGEPGRTEADVARQRFVDLGGDDRRVVLEPRARNTEENARFTREILDALGAEPRRVVVVTDSGHAARAEGVFRRHFTSVAMFSSQAPGAARVKLALREVVGLVGYASRGWLGRPDGVNAEARRLADLAWPAVLGQLGTMVMGVVDVVMVGHYGEDALGGVGLGHTWSFAVGILAMGASMGLDPLFAQAIGARERGVAGRALRAGLIVILALAVPVMAAHWAAAPALTAMGEPAALVPIADAYCRVLSFGVVPMLLAGIVRQLLQAHGRMGPGAVAVGFGNVLNVILNALLVYGLWGAPELGPVGSAWATVASRWLMLAVLAWMGRRELGLTWLAGAGVPPPVREVARTCIPVGFQVGLEVWAFTGTSLLMGAFGPTAVAAHTVALNLCSLSFMVPFGISAAAATRVGHLIGEGRAWATAAWTSIGAGASVMVLSATMFLLFPGQLVSLYSPSPTVIALAAALLPIAAGFQLFDGTQAVAFGVLRGAGDTRVPALANVVGYYVIGLPLGLALAHRGGLGPQGLWIGLTVGLASVATLLLLRLRGTVARGGFRVRA